MKFLRFPFFGLVSNRSPLDGLIDHYEKISDCLAVIDESLECYVRGGACREFAELLDSVNEIEARADKIKRSIRNHLPRGVFMPVDKTLFLNYTKSQDNVLDSAQDAMHWLGMRQMIIPEPHRSEVIELLDQVTHNAELLGPSLKATIQLVNGTIIDREATKNTFRAVRKQRGVVREKKNELLSAIYNSDMDFKDIYQLMLFVECLDDMSHACENCADILRSMIAR
jgi:hypothetical protein